MRDHILGLAQDIQRNLEVYVAIHNDIFKGFKGSLRRVIPIPGIFEAIEYPSHEATLGLVLDNLTAIDDKLRKESRRISKDEQLEDLVRVIPNYLEALINTVSIFHTMCHELAEKAEHVGAYSWSQYKRDLQTYHASIEIYVRLGEELNQIMRSTR